MRRKLLYGGLAATIVAAGLAVGAAVVPAMASTSAGCGASTDWHYISQYHSDYLDGTSETYPTVVVALSDYQSGSAFAIRTKVWGTQDAINNIDSGYASNALIGTGVSQVTFNMQPSSGSSLTFQSSSCPTQSTTSLGEWSVLLDYVPYGIGSDFTALANDLSIGVNQVTSTMYQQKWQWNQPSYNRLIPAGTAPDQAEKYMGYSQQTMANANAGYGIKSAGTVEYETTYWEDPPLDRYVYYAYDTSGSPTTSGSVEPFQ